MNKKLFAGFASVAALSSFWACGDGNINKFDDEDGITAEMYATEPERQGLMEASMAACEADPVCEAQYHDYLLDPEGYSSAEEDTPESSASTGTNSSASLTFSSSSIVISGKVSSSSLNIVEGSSSSGAGTTPVTGLGSCAPETNPISKGGATKWKFTPNTSTTNTYTVMDFAKASYKWTFDAGATDDGSGTSTTSGSVTYATSGAHAASVVVTMSDGKSENVECSSLQVNGAPITCTCETAAISPYDFTSASGATVTWTATCSSAGANIIGYQWTGAEGSSEIGSYTFTDETTVTPKVTVSNDDNSVQEFECPAIKGTNGPENEFDLATATDEQKALQQGVTYTVKHPYSAAIQFNGSTADCTIEINGESVEISHYKAIQPAPASPVVVKPINCTATIGGY